MKRKIVACLLTLNLISMSSVSALAVSDGENEAGINYFEYSIKDATEAQRVSAGFVEPNDFYLDSYDVNDDGLVSILDATTIQKHCVNLCKLSEKVYENIRYYAGNRVAKVASSYYLASVNGSDTFKIAEGSIFTPVLNEEVDSTSDYQTPSLEVGVDCKLRDAEGNAYIDKVTFAGLSMMSIWYEDTPYRNNKGNNAVWNTKELMENNSVLSWKYKDLISGVYSICSEEGYSEEKVLNVSADYFKNNTEVVYDASTVVTSESTIDLSSISKLHPGDIIFYRSGNDYSINNIGIVTEKTGKCFILSDDGTINYNDITEDWNNISFICRQDYSVEG